MDAAVEWTAEERKALAVAIRDVRTHAKALKGAKETLQKVCGVTSPAQAARLLTADLLGNRAEVEAEIAAKNAAKEKSPKSEASDEDDE